MTPTERTILLIYAATVALWPIRLLVLMIVERRLDFLTRRSPAASGPDLPLVTAFIPAKDEESTLAGCLETVAAQTYPNLEILVVDDRSGDRTPEIARAFAEREPRARVVTLTDLPPGWTGKTHALHVAVGQARGDWYWFVDADTRHEPESLAVTLEYARSHGAAMASLIPRMRAESFWENVVQPLAGMVLMQAYPPLLANSPRFKLAFANGQYILIRRDAYEAAGGHRAVRDRFVEDIHLARRVKGLGLPVRTAMGLEVSSTRMYTSLGSIVRGWSRILYDAFDRKPWKLLLGILDPLIFSKPAFVALPVAIGLLATGARPGFAPWLLALSLAHLALMELVLRRCYRLSAPTTRYASWYPLASLVLDWILLRGVWMCATGRVSWRGTDYGRPPGPPLQSEGEVPMVRPSPGVATESPTGEASGSDRAPDPAWSAPSPRTDASQG